MPLHSSPRLSLYCGGEPRDETSWCVTKRDKIPAWSTSLLLPDPFENNPILSGSPMIKGWTFDHLPTAHFDASTARSSQRPSDAVPAPPSLLKSGFIKISIPRLKREGGREREREGGTLKEWGRIRKNAENKRHFSNTSEVTVLEVSSKISTLRGWEKLDMRIKLSCADMLSTVMKVPKQGW